jgi:hypothetical protein
MHAQPLLPQNVDAMSDRAVYRVTFSGDELELQDEVMRALSLAGVAWEGNESGDGPSRHRVLVRGSSPRGAIGDVRDALAGLGDFDGFAAEPVRDAQGNVWRGKFYRRWHEVEWEDVPERATLTELQRAAMGAVADAAEPTALVVREVGRSARLVETALRELREKGLVDSHTEPFWDGERGDDQAEWWKLTDEAWDLLGFIKSPRYH